MQVTPGGPAEVSLMLRIEFAFDSAELTAQAMRDLDGVAAALNGPELATAQLTLEGHTDATGAEGYNLRLSERRAEAVVTYLAGRGVARPRLRPVGFGEDRLLPAPQTSCGRGDAAIVSSATSHARVISLPDARLGSCGGEC